MDEQPVAAAAARACVNSASCAVVKTSGRPPASSVSRRSGTGISCRSWTTASSAWPPPPTIAITRSPTAKRSAPGPSADDLAGELEARDVGRRAGRRRIATAQLHHVGAVQPAPRDAHEHLAGAGDGVGVLAQLDLAVDDRRGPHGAKASRTSRSSSATHSMWCVCGNMSTGRDRDQPVAGGDQFRRVRRERRRVARDVDDPPRGRLDDPAGRLSWRARHAAGRRPRTSGRPASLHELRQRQARVAGEEADVADLVAPRRGDRVGDRRLDDLDPPDLAGARREPHRDRADPAVEVEDPLEAAQRRALGGDPVEHLGHLGVGLEERLGGDPQVELAELLGQVFVAPDELGLAALRSSRRAARCASRAVPRAPRRARR